MTSTPQRSPAVRLATRWCFGLILGLVAGCGGGSSDSASSDPTDAGPTYRLAAVATNTSTGQDELLVWGDTGSTLAYATTDRHWFSITDDTYDTSTKTVTRGHVGRVFFMGASGLSMVDLHGQAATPPASLTAPSGTCRVLSAAGLDTAGRAAVLQIAQSDASGVCQWTATSLLEVAADGSTLSIPLVDERLIQPLRNPDGQVAGLLMAVKVAGGGEWAAWRAVGSTAAPTWLGEVPATVTTPVEWLGQDAGQAGLGYLKLNGQLRSLRWSGQQVSLDTSVLHTFSSTGTTSFAGDAQGVYFNDGLALLRASNGTVNSLGTLGDDTPDLSVQNMVLTSGRVAAMLTTPNTLDCLGCADLTRLVQSVARAGSTSTTLWKEHYLYGGNIGGAAMSLSWGAGDKVVLQNCGFNTTSLISYCNPAVLSEAQEGTTANVDSASQVFMPVMPRSVAQGSTATQITALITTSNQGMAQINLPGQDTLNLGAVASSSIYDQRISCSNALDQTTSACTVAAQGSSSAEAWTFTPSVANSMRRISAP